MRGIAAFIVAGSIASVASAQLNFTIDDFDTGAIGGSASNAANFGSVAADVIGGIRTLEASVVTNPVDSTDDVMVEIGPDNGEFMFDTGPLAVVNATLSYGDGGDDLLPTQLLSLDFLQFDFVSADRDFTFVVTLANDGVEASATVNVSADSNPQTVFANIFDFTGDLALAPISDVDSITIDFNTTDVESLDFRLDSIVGGGGIVPTPASAALLGLGGLAAARRRR